jgi:hypothetical protein
MDMAWQDPANNYADKFGSKAKGSETLDRFDLIEYQDKARDIYSPKRLFDLWEDVCKKYDRGVIRSYDLDEMKAVIWPKLHMLARSKYFMTH